MKAALTSSRAVVWRTRVAAPIAVAVVALMLGVVSPLSIHAAEHQSVLRAKGRIEKGRSEKRQSICRRRGTRLDAGAYTFIESSALGLMERNTGKDFEPVRQLVQKAINHEQRLSPAVANDLLVRIATQKDLIKKEGVRTFAASLWCALETAGWKPDLSIASAEKLAGTPIVANTIELRHLIKDTIPYSARIAFFKKMTNVYPDAPSVTTREPQVIYGVYDNGTVRSIERESLRVYVPQSDQTVIAILHKRPAVWRRFLRNPLSIKKILPRREVTFEKVSRRQRRTADIGEQRQAVAVWEPDYREERHVARVVESTSSPTFLDTDKAAEIERYTPADYCKTFTSLSKDGLSPQIRGLKTTFGDEKHEINLGKVFDLAQIQVEVSGDREPHFFIPFRSSEGAPPSKYGVSFPLEKVDLHNIYRLRLPKSSPHNSVVVPSKLRHSLTTAILDFFGERVMPTDLYARKYGQLHRELMALGYAIAPHTPRDAYGVPKRGVLLERRKKHSSEVHPDAICVDLKNPFDFDVSTPWPEIPEPIRKIMTRMVDQQTIVSFLTERLKDEFFEHDDLPKFFRRQNVFPFHVDWAYVPNEFRSTIIKQLNAEYPRLPKAWVTIHKEQMSGQERALPKYPDGLVY